MPSLKEYEKPGRYQGGRRPFYVGTAGDPSAPASSTASIPRSLAGALDPDCDEYLFDCPGKEMEEEEEPMDEALLREFVRGILLTEKEEIIDEDELEEDDEVEEVNAIGMGGGAGISRGNIRGVTLPLGASPPTHGRKRRTPAEAAGSGFGGAKPYMPGKKKRGKKKRRKSK
jgi:hypothetical protein